MKTLPVVHAVLWQAVFFLLAPAFPAFLFPFLCQALPGQFPGHLHKVHALDCQIVAPVAVLQLHDRGQKMAYVNGAAAAGPGLAFAHAYDPVRVRRQHRVLVLAPACLLFQKIQDILPQLYGVASESLILLGKSLIKGHSVDDVFRHKIAVPPFPRQLYGPLHDFLHISAEFHLFHLAPYPYVSGTASTFRGWPSDLAH